LATEGLATLTSKIVLNIRSEQALWADYLSPESVQQWYNQCLRRENELFYAVSKKLESADEQNRLFSFSDSDDVFENRAVYYVSLRKKIQEKLIKFATRIPIFMYLTDYRERTLRDVITQLEPGLFKKVTGLTVKDFELLVSLGVFNSAMMNDAVYKFKRYEDPSLVYAGINLHEGEDIGLYDTVLRRVDYKAIIVGKEM
jgi:hypothetical protein